MAERHGLRVSCKCALYTADGSKVLLSRYGPQNGFGLPGGHVEADETPDEAMGRELLEEVGLTGVAVTKRDFWMHDDGKLVLGYTGVLDETTKLKIQLEEISDAVWIAVSEIAEGRVVISSYSKFICQFQPKA